MINILIKENTSYGSVKAFKNLMSNFKNVEFVKAEVRYDKRHLLDESDPPENWPLQLYTTNNMKISVYNVTAGYGGTGPHDMKEILDLCGFIDTHNVLEYGNLDFKKEYA